MDCPGTLLICSYKPVTCDDAGERADADSRSGGDRPSCKRQVSGSIPLTGSQLGILVSLLTCT